MTKKHIDELTAEEREQLRKETGIRPLPDTDEEGEIAMVMDDGSAMLVLSPRRVADVISICDMADRYLTYLGSTATAEDWNQLRRVRDAFPDLPPVATNPHRYVRDADGHIIGSQG